MGAFDLKRALDEATIGPGAQRRIPFQIRRAALERPPVIMDRGIIDSPIFAPIFSADSIPPVFDGEDDGLDVIPGGGIPGVSTGTFTGEDIELGQISVGQPVPPVKQSRGDRLRALLGNFLQNFGTGLQAASRAPSGSEFAAGFGGALSASEERRRQQMFEDLLRARQASRLAEAAERKRRFDLTFEAGEAQRAQERIDEENAAVRAERLALADISADEAAATIGGIERKRARSFRQMLEERKFRRGIKGQKEILSFQDILTRRKPGKFPEAERKRLAESLALQLGIELPGTGPTGGLSPTGSFQFMLKLSRIGTLIDALARRGADQDQILRTFEVATAKLKKDTGKDPTPEKVLQLVRDKLSQ